MGKFDLEKFRKEALDLHNKIREEHGAPPLKHSLNLEKGAEKRVKELIKLGKLEHETNLKGISENIMSFSGHEPTAELVVMAWAEEEKNYSYEKNEFQPNSGHFTQLIWVNTAEFGISIDKSSDNQYYAVARYSPCGNYQGMFTENVLKKGSKMATRSGTPSVPLSFVPDEYALKKKKKKAHKVIRDKHNSPLLKWDSKMAEKALAAAKAYVESKENKTAEPTFCAEYGRNVLFAEGGIPPLADIFMAWYSQSSKYDYKLNEFQKGAASFSQMVWHDSNLIGAGMYEKNKKCALVCYYSPPGNVEKGYSRNVEKPKDSATISFGDL